jgi:hypothetical protein
MFKKIDFNSIMPPKSKFKSIQKDKINKRWESKKRARPLSSVDIIDSNNNNLVFNDEIDENLQLDKETQTEDALFITTYSQTEEIKIRDISTQTSKLVDPMKSDYELKIKKDVCLSNICHLYDILKDSCPNWNSIQDRVFSVIVYMLLKSFDLKWDCIANILDELNCINIKYAHAWCRSIIDNGSINILDDQRGKHHHFMMSFMICTPKLK